MVKDEELEQLLNELFTLHGYDFTNYAQASLRRRINRLFIVDRIASFAELLYRLRNDTAYARHMVEQLTVNVTEMFRDPQVYRYIREKLLPILATHPIIRIWHAGCSTGEEVYSMAILLEEANLLHKSLLYATDMNPAVVENVQKGVFPLTQMKNYSENYIHSGGKNDFSSYYTAQYDWAIFDKRFRERMIASTHNLVSDRSFNEFQVIFCRNVLIYFDKDLQNQVLNLFEESLESLGYLVLGTKENIRFSPIASRFVQIDPKEKIWRKMK